MNTFSHNIKRFFIRRYLIHLSYQKNVISFEMIDFFFFKFKVPSSFGRRLVPVPLRCTTERSVEGTPIDEITLKDSFYAIQDKKDEEVSRSG